MEECKMTSREHHLEQAIRQLIWEIDTNQTDIEAVRRELFITLYGREPKPETSIYELKEQAE